MKATRAHVNLSVTHDERDRIREVAEWFGLSVSELARRVLLEPHGLYEDVPPRKERSRITVDTWRETRGR